MTHVCKNRTCEGLLRLYTSERPLLCLYQRVSDRRRRVVTRTKGRVNVYRDQAGPQAQPAAGDDPAAAAGDQAAAAVSDGARRPGPRRDDGEPHPRGRRGHRRRSSARTTRDAKPESELAGRDRAAASRRSRAATRPSEVTGTESTAESQAVNEIDWENYIESYSSAPSMPSYKPSNDELPSLESTLTKKTSLDDHLVWQLRMSQLAAETKRTSAC